MRIFLTSCLLGALAIAPVAAADTIVQEGSLSGTVGISVHSIDLDQFDTQGGARTLDAVRLDLLTSVVGGGQTNGPGGPDVTIFAQLATDYLLGTTPLASTDAIINTVIHQNGPPVSFTVFDTDTAQAVIDDPADLGPWTGAGLVTLTARVTFGFSEDPVDEIAFSAGGSAQYTVTYEFTENDPCSEDLDGDGNVGFTDLSALLAAWGTCPACPEDLDGDDSVGFTDLSELLAGWGACP